MNINTDNPIIKFSEKGKPFPYDKLFFATIESYILEFKNARLEKLTEEDAARCLARIYKRMEVNGVPVLEFFKEDLDKWSDLDQYNKTLKLADLIANDIFCCFDKNRINGDGSFCRCNRLYCVNNGGERDFIICDTYEKSGMFKKTPTAETIYFRQLKDQYDRGWLPKTKDK